MKKNLILILLILSFCFSTLVDGFAADKTENTFQSGIELFNKNLYEPAYDVFLKIFEDDPENIELNFYLGRAAFEIGNYEMAVMAFERILITSPFEQRVKLELARSYKQLGSNNMARKYCNEVLTSDPPETVTSNINTFLSSIEKSEQVHFLNGQISIGVDWNNNVWASPSSRTIRTVIGDIDLTGVSATKKHDYIYNTIAGLNHSYRPLYSKQSWETQAVIYQGLYDKASDLDIFYISGQTGPEFIIDHNKIGFSVLMNQIEVDDDKYESTIGFQASLDHIINPGLILSTTIDIKNHDFFDNSPRDSMDKSISFEAGFSYHDNWFNIGLKAQKESAKDDEYSYKKYSAFATATRKLLYNTIGSLSYEYQDAKYKGDSPFFGQRRSDHLHFAGIGLRKKIWQSQSSSFQNIFVNLNYQHIWTFSNIELHEYTKDLAQLSLTYHF